MSAGSLVLASPSGDHRHDDEDCAEDDSGPWPALRMSESAAGSYGNTDCPDCRGGDEPGPEPGFGLGMSADDFSAGGRVAARTVAQWFAGTVDRRYVDPDRDTAHRLVCTADQGYEFHVEETRTGRTRVKKMSGGRVTANVLELAGSKR